MAKGSGNSIGTIIGVVIVAVGGWWIWKTYFASGAIGTSLSAADQAFLKSVGGIPGYKNPDAKSLTKALSLTPINIPIYNPSNPKMPNVDLTGDAGPMQKDDATRDWGSGIVN